MQIGQLAAATGVPVRTIRFYEDKGILPPPPRTPAGYRDYDHQAFTRLRFLRSAQDAGLTLAEIRSILAIRTRGEAPCVHTRGLLKAKRDEIADRLKHLQELQSELGRLIEASDAINADICDPDDICSIIPTTRGQVDLAHHAR
jgi:DNA-binding transcriptional MerR regulator